MTQVQQAPTDSRRRRIEDTTRGRIRSYLRSKDDWNPARGLKNLTEQAVRDYEHRAVLELVQNAHDAHEAGQRSGRIMVWLDSGEGQHGVLYVANTGKGFDDSNFDAISDIARSDKRPDEGIGNKGIGFKSVLQLSRTPEVYSTAEESGEGYNFRFATGRELREQLIRIAEADIADVAVDIERDVFHLCLPIPQPHHPTRVTELLAEGYATVIRLPLKSDDARADAVAQMRLLCGTPPTLLFLRRIAELNVEIKDPRPFRETLRRQETPVAELDDHVSASIVDLGSAGRYFVADKMVPEATLAVAIQRSIEGDHISDGWRDWRGDAHVSVAARLDDEPGDNRLYAHLPMGRDARAPLAAHVNGPFFAKLARVGLEQSVPLNDTLLNEVAELCARLLLAAAGGGLPIDDDTLADLLSWRPDDAERLRDAFAALGHSVATAPVIPIQGKAGSRSSLAHVYAWNDGTCLVLTTDRLARDAHVSLLPAGLSKQRRVSLGAVAEKLARRTLTASDAEIAVWAERIAHSIASAPFDAETWASFYDDLAGAVKRHADLHGRKILVDDDHKLRNCNGAGDGPVAFFSPRSEADAPAGADDLKPPAALRRQLFFVSPALRWNTRTGSISTKRPGRAMLEIGLVREYRANALFPVIGAALKRNPALAAEVLLWTYRFATGLDDPPWREIRDMHLLVPCSDGEWLPASQVHLSKDWGGAEAGLLEELLRHTASEFTDMADLRRRLLAGPTAAPFHGHQPERWRNFLVHIGVRTGLDPDPVSESTLRGNGTAFQQNDFTLPRTLTRETAQLWRRACGRALPQGRRPQTQYLSRRPLYRLAGQDDYVRFSAGARLTYARLIAHGLARWPDEMLAVTVSRYNDSTDSFTLPTPIAAFLSEAEWLPVTAPLDRTNLSYRTASEAWSDREDAPPFASIIAPQVRRLIHTDPHAEARAGRLGIRTWDDPATAGDRVKLLAHLLETGLVPGTVLPQFRSAYEEAWVTFVAHSNSGTPLDGMSRAPLVVTRGSTTEVIDLAARDVTAPLFIQDTDGRQRLQMLEQCGLPVLRLRHRDASKVADRLNSTFGTRVRRVSSVNPAVTVDADLFTPSDTLPLLVRPDQEWFADLVATVIDLRGQRIHTGRRDALRRAIAILRRIRVVECSQIEAGIGGYTVGVRHLAVPHENYPTVVLIRTPDQQQRLERAAPGVVELLGYPALGDTLRLTLKDLASDGYGPDRPAPPAAIADILGEPVTWVEEVRAAIRRPDEITLEVLIPLVAVFDLAHARGLDGDHVAITPGEVAAWLCGHSGATVTPEILLPAAAEGIDAARQVLGVELRTLNTAIRTLGAPYRPLMNAEGIEQQFRAFVAERTHAILDALRQAYLSDFRAGRQLDRYLAHRTMAGLDADPEWAADYYPTVPDERMSHQINAWLAAAGAHGLGATPETGGADGAGTTAGLKPLDKLRTDNRAAVLSWTARAAKVVRAYENHHGRTISDLPGALTTAIADAAGETGILDFEPISLDRFIAWLADTQRWPTGMPQSLDLATLGLPANALDLAREQQEQARQHREQERRTVKIDDKPILADDSNYAQIAAAIWNGITQQFRDDSGKTSLADPGPPAQRTPGWGGSGTTAARQPKPSETQTAAIGFAGEVAALEWLKARYPGVTELQCWVSGYRNQLLGDDVGDDTLGYDLVIERGRQRLMFEVKATSGEQAEFQLTPLEIARAQRLRRHESYEILFVTNVFSSPMRRIHRLPNPLDPANGHLYRTIGDGVRYRFTITSP